MINSFTKIMGMPLNENSMIISKNILKDRLNQLDRKTSGRMLS